MNTSSFINNDNRQEEIEILNIAGATSNTFKRRINGRLYFMKLLRPELSHNTRYRNVFFKEFEAGKSIVSPYIAKYVSIEEDTDGLYILMEYVNGVTVEEKLATEPEYFHKNKNVKRLLMQLSQALSVLHKRGIVHLDVKPENILLTKTNNDVVLVDLGFCLSNSNDNTAGCTKQFAAPETLAGKINDIDARSDIYSVGCLLQYIEEKSGKNQNSTINSIKEKCLQTQKTERFSSAKEIADAVSNKRKWYAALCIVAVLLSAVFLLPKSSLYNNVCDYIAWEHGDVPQKFEKDGIFYRITDGEARTVEVTFKGNHPDEYEYEYNGGEIIIPQTVTYKGRTFRVTAFAGQAFKTPYISKVTIPEGIEVIADSAFIYCNQSGVITIPKSVKKIGKSAFFPMLYIDSLVVDAENPYYDSRGGCNAIIETATGTLLAGCNNTVIPDGVVRIAQNAFVGAQGLKHLVLPASLKEIGEAAFVHCGITEIEIPEGVTKLERYTFQYCENLQRVTLPQSLVTIGHAALSHCAYNEIVIPDGVTEIEDYAFDCCEYLETAVIGRRVRSIGYGAFENCKRLKTVVSHIPADSLFAVDNNTFGNISPDCILYVPRGAKSAYEKTFGWNRITDIKELD